MYVNVSLTKQAYELLKELKQKWGLRSYSEVILKLYESYKECKPSFEHKELSIICSLLDENWDSLANIVKRLVEGGK